MTKEENTKTKEENNKAIYDTARDEKVSELDILHQSLEEIKKQSDQYYDQLLRLKAEFDNYRKRTEKERQQYMLWGKEDVLRSQVTLMDVMEQACGSTKSCTNLESIKQGIELIHLEFAKMLQNEGISEIECLGKKFDPHLEEAVEHTESDKEEGTIIEVVQKGYCLNGKLIRHARVKVSKGKTPNAEEGEKKD